MVKLLSLEVSRLYGVFDYNVKFNSDVTFIYGENGCGKTTILNITEAIITGQLFNLFNYDFKTIRLTYSLNGNNMDVKIIEITNKPSVLKIIFNDNPYQIERMNLGIENITRLKKYYRESNQFYYNRYTFLKEIKDTFNYVYLPLNRSSVYYNKYNDDYIIPRNLHEPWSDDIELTNMKTELSIRDVEALVASNYININSKIAVFNDEFRNDVLKSLIEVNSDNAIENSLLNIIKQKNSVNEMQKIKKTYLKTLSELELLTDKEENSFNKFFEGFMKEFTAYKTSSTKGVSLSLISKFQEIIKIQRIVDIAQKAEEKKSVARKPIETFLSTMNEFIGNNTYGKQIQIDDEGNVYFTTNYSRNPISVQYLSSGEKQLLIFFANLIFKVQSGKSGIFVVDEPELSLHLSWQKKFVKKALSINNNLQLIFATHAPEIVGSMRNKMYKLEKYYIEQAGN